MSISAQLPVVSAPSRSLVGQLINCHSVVSLASQPPNHSSATCFPDFIDSFLSAELEHTATAGPFTHSPFPAPIHTSPLQTVPKDAQNSALSLILASLLAPLSTMEFQKILNLISLSISPHLVLHILSTLFCPRVPAATFTRKI